MTEQPRVAVIGAGGAIGGFFAAHLIAAGRAEVTLCVRSPFDELVVESAGEELRSRPPVLTDAQQVDGPVDWILLATKAHQTEGAAAWLDALAGPATKVVVLQNGVEHEARVRPFLRHASTEIIPAVVYCGAEATAPGHVIHRTNGFLIVPAGPSADELADLYEPARAGIRPTDDFTTAVWQKLSANVVVNGITALTERRSEVMRRPDIAALGRVLIEECVAVARAEGADIDDGWPDLVLRGVASMPEGSATSMYYDRMAGHPLEYDAKYGAVVRFGRRHDIPTPMNDAFVALLAAISDAPDAG